MPHEHLFLIRYSGEVCTKARKTRHRFCRQIAACAEDALLSAGIPFDSERTWSRLFVRAASPEAGPLLARLFGVQSVSPAVERPWQTLEEIVDAGFEFFRDSVLDRSFAVRARRTGGHQQFPFRSPDVERALGRRLLNTGRAVNLSKPEVTAYVEAHPTRCFFFTEILEGPAGLPTGVEGRALSLVSGGLDSAVASWLMAKRGVAQDFVFFNLGGPSHAEGALEVLRVLGRDWSYGDWPRLFSIDFRPVVPMLEKSVHPRFWQLLLKYLMYRAAEELAEELGIGVLVTGEAVGQVSSQTLPNLAALTATCALPVLRPLAAFNKEEIVSLARRIGTHDLSARVPEYCALDARRSETSVRAQRLLEEVASLDLDLVSRCVAEAETTELRAAPDASADRPLGLELEDIPPGAAIVDLRSRDEYRQDHLRSALHLEFFEALQAFPSFDPEQPYVLYCDVGFKSAHLAESMRRAGFHAFHVPGGWRAVRRSPTWRTRRRNTA